MSNRHEHLVRSIQCPPKEMVKAAQHLLAAAQHQFEELGSRYGDKDLAAAEVHKERALAEFNLAMRKLNAEII
ncbi:hypothetical protein [Pyruvatibacter sp.]